MNEPKRPPVANVRIERFERVYECGGRYFIARKAERIVGINPGRAFTVWEVAEANAEFVPIAQFAGEATRIADVKFDIQDRVHRDAQREAQA